MAQEMQFGIIGEEMALKTAGSGLMIRMRFMIVLIVVIMLLSLARAEIVTCLVPAGALISLNPAARSDGSGLRQSWGHDPGTLETSQAVGVRDYLTPGT
jgi:hypothetical protein